MKGKDSFDRIAEEYDSIRPGYSECIIDTIKQYAHLSTGARILEIGAGSGQLTQSFAHGYEMTCIEPGAGFCQLLKVKFPVKNIRIVNQYFERFEDESGAYDLILSGTAFHWVDPKSGFPLIHRLLKPGGTCALMWHTYNVSRGTAMEDRIDDIYTQYSDELAKTKKDRGILCTQADTQYWIMESGLFSQYKHIEEDFELVLSAEEFVHLTSTHSSHQLLDESVRSSMLEQIRSVIEKHGGRIQKTIRTVMDIAKTRSK